MFLLDSDHLIELSRGRPSVQGRMAEVGLSICAVSEISMAELYVGYYKYGKKIEALLDFLEESLQVVPINSAIKTYAQLRAQLELSGQRVEDMDLFIAATAIAKDITLVTHNTRYFSRIPGLKLEDWIA